MKETHKKTINGHIELVLRAPIKFQVDAYNEKYIDSKGKEFTDEEWEYSVDEILEQHPELQNFINQLKQNWTVEEISIEDV